MREEQSYQQVSGLSEDMFGYQE